MLHRLDRYSTTHPDLVHRLLQSTYVDDIATGAETEEEALELYEKSKKCLEMACSTYGSSGLTLKNYNSASTKQSNHSSLLLWKQQMDPTPATQMNHTQMLHSVPLLEV